MLGLPPGHVRTIYNPIANDDLIARSHEPLEHPWFQPGEPKMLLAVGRLREQKNFQTLLHAFRRVVHGRPCCLMILGEGEERGQLEAEVRLLGLEDVVALPGFVENPYAFMRAASLFVLSSRWEDLPTHRVDRGAGVRLSGGRHRLSQWAERNPWRGPMGTFSGGRRRRGAGYHHPGHDDASGTGGRARGATFSYDRAIASYVELLSAL